MKIQLLSFPDCPNAEPAMRALREAMKLDGLTDQIEELDVSSPAAPAWAKRWASPTILVDDVDVCGASETGTSACCRLYANGSPSVEQIRARFAEARKRD